MKNFFSLIPASQKYKMVLFFLLTIVLMILESLSIAIIIPFLSFIIDGDINNLPYANHLNLFLDLFEFENLLIFLTLLILIVYIFKNIFLIYIRWWSYNFVNHLVYNLETRLFENYIKQKYFKVISLNSAEKIRNIRHETSSFAKYLNCLIVIIIELMVFFGILFLIFLIYAWASLISLVVFASVAFLFYIASKKLLIKWSEKKIFHSGKSLKGILEAFNAIKEVKIFRKENFFIKNFSHHVKKALKFNTWFNTYNEVPKIFSEIIVIIFICTFTIYMSAEGVSKKEILTSLALFAVATIRLLPSTTRIISSMNVCKSALPSVDILANELKDEMINNKNDLLKKDFLEIKENIVFSDVSLTFPNQSLPILKNINFKINSGDMIGISGKSGSGKSTLINLLTGLIEPTSGKIFFDNKIMNVQTKFNIGYISQETLLLDNTIKYNIIFGEDESEFDEKKLLQAVKIADLEELINSLENGLDTYIGEKGFKISGGQRQKIAIARALYTNSSILIFDEATNQIDENTEVKIFENLRKISKEKTIFFVSHNLSLFSYCDRILEIKNDKINFIEKNENT